MSFYGSVIDAMGEALAADATSRTVLRDLTDFSDMPEDIIREGVYTLIANGTSREDVRSEHLKVLLVGQIELEEAADPSDVEEAEHTMMDEVRSYLNRITGVYITDAGFRQSAQVDAPYGFISLALSVGPFSVDPRPSTIISMELPDTSTLPTGVYISKAPDIGTGHEDDYINIEDL